MAKDLPDYMREFDTSDDWGFTPVTSKPCLLYTSPSPRDSCASRMPSSA